MFPKKCNFCVARREKVLGVALPEGDNGFSNFCLLSDKNCNAHGHTDKSFLTAREGRGSVSIS